MADTQTSDDDLRLSPLGMQPPASPAAPAPSGGGRDTNAIVEQLLRKFANPPAPPNIIPFQQAKDKIEAQRAALPVPQAPQLQPTPQNAPEPQVTDVFQAMGSPMMLMALLGGALTSTPITSAMNNAAGFLNGVRKGDAAATKNHFDKFQADLDAAKAANQSAIEQYRLAFEQYSGQSDQLKQQLDGIADRENDEVIKHKLEEGQFDEVWKIIEAREKNQQALQVHQDMLNLRVDGAWGSTTDLTMKDGSHVQGQRNKITGEYRGEDGEEIDRSNVKSEQRLALPARSAPALALQKFIEKNPDATPEAVTKFAADYAEQVKAAKDWGTGPLGNQTRSFSVGLYHLETLQELADALKNGDINTFNAIANKWGAETGQAAPTNFNTARQIIGAEVVKAIVGAGGGGVQERLEAANHISTSLSPEQMAGAIKTTEDLMVGQLKGLKSQYERTTKNSDFEDTFLSPEARDLFQNSTAKAPQTGGPKEGDRSKSKSGRDIIFRNGQWEYAE
jgi:hypothetical protein